MLAKLWKPVQTKIAAATFEAAAPTAQAARNRRAFLDTIAVAEGTSDANGYAALFGHRANAPSLFSNWADHPRIARQFVHPTRGKLWTSAAGKYQFMAISPTQGGGSTKVDTWDRVKRALGLPDFSPASQDQAALFLIHEKGALGLVDAGRFAEAIAKVREVWASLPGAGYGQPERTMERLAKAYLDAGGNIA